MNDYTAVFRNLRTSRVSLTPVEHACAVERHSAASSLIPPVLGVLGAFAAAVAIALFVMERIGL